MSDYSKSIYFKCSCGSETLQIERNRYDATECHRDFSFCLWYYSIYGTLSFYERLRWCFRILKTGNPWADTVILTDNDAKNLAEFIKTELNYESKTK